MTPCKSLHHLLVALLILGCLGPLAAAGTIRHDKADSLYLELAGQYPSVGQIVGYGDGRELYASGTLIAPNWVLTAGHIAAPERVYGFTLDSLNFHLSGKTYSAKSWIAHENFVGDFFSLLFSGYDIGLVELDEQITEITPAERYTGRGELGRIGTSVGYGATGTGSTGSQWPPDPWVLDKRAGENRIDGWLEPGTLRSLFSRNLRGPAPEFVSLMPPGDPPRGFLSDFDNPLDRRDSLLGSPKALPLEYMVYLGDSGGGVFIDNKLAGIHSAGLAFDGLFNADYGDISLHTRVSVFNDWIDAILDGDYVTEGGQPSAAGGALSGTSPFAYTGAMVVPEPSALWLACLGGLCLIGYWWRRTKR